MLKSEANLERQAEERKRLSSPWLLRKIEEAEQI